MQPGTCELSATRHRDMAKATGTPVTISAVPGRDVFDVVLVAPEAPEPREQTAEEGARSRKELCDYWIGQGTRMVALTEKIGADQTPGTKAYAEWQELVQSAKQTAADSRKSFCDDE